MLFVVVTLVTIQVDVSRRRNRESKSRLGTSHSSTLFFGIFMVCDFFRYVTFRYLWEEGEKNILNNISRKTIHSRGH